MSVEEENQKLKKMIQELEEALEKEKEAHEKTKKDFEETEGQLRKTKKDFEEFKAVHSHTIAYSHIITCEEKINDFLTRQS